MDVMPMEVVLNNIGKRYRFEWIFRQIQHTFTPDKAYALLGPNGSGKSTLMKILSGHLSPSEGEIEFIQHGKRIDTDEVYRQIAYAAPYIELIEEFSLLEGLEFHQAFKPFLDDLRPIDLIDILQFASSKNKEIRFFSSGMKQRLKLVLAICSNTPLLLLDEPTTNLDAQGVDWYQELIDRYKRDRLLIVASNIEQDYVFCEEQLNILNYKPVKKKRKRG
ncbi:MAG: ATP-binding cassette domain-containing protein [Bacteroidota bacterium]